jgi:carbonic anhydrase/acetyltransferase-like protein (isoleucine patch superfamily)
MLGDLRFYLHSKSSSVWRYALSETVQALLGWAPGLPGIAARAVAYKAILHAEGFSAIEDHVRIVRSEDVWLGERVYLDHGVYLHGGRGGLHIGEGSWIMHGSSLHVFNFREMPQSGIRLGRRTFVGEGTMMRGQGGIRVGDNVLFGPGVQLLAVNHVFTDPDRPVMDQGITAEGIVIEDNCWIGAGALVLDGVTIGRGATVGAGSVVTSSVPPHKLVVGSPARVIRDLRSHPLTAAATTEVFRGGMERFR